MELPDPEGALACASAPGVLALIGRIDGLLRANIGNAAGVKADKPRWRLVETG